MQRVLITGASSGIGLATAQKLIAQGVEVVGIARDFSKVDLPQIKTIECDLGDVEQLMQMLGKEPLLEQFFDSFILNAGYGQFGGLEQFSYQQIQQLLNTNLISHLFLIKHFLPQLKLAGNKDIVFIGSESALKGAKQGAVYCASKFAIRGLAQSLRADFAGNNVRVILINPGPVNTDFFDDLHFQPQHGEEYAMSAEAIADTIEHALKQPRNVVIEEINLQPLKRAFSKKP